MATSGGHLIHEVFAEQVAHEIAARMDAFMLALLPRWTWAERERQAIEARSIRNRLTRLRRGWAARVWDLRYALARRLYPFDEDEEAI